MGRQTCTSSVTLSVHCGSTPRGNRCLAGPTYVCFFLRSPFDGRCSVAVVSTARPERSYLSSRAPGRGRIGGECVAGEGERPSRRAEEEGLPETEARHSPGTRRRGGLWGAREGAGLRGRAAGRVANQCRAELASARRRGGPLDALPASAELSLRPPARQGRRQPLLSRAPVLASMYRKGPGVLMREAVLTGYSMPCATREAVSL